MVALHLQFAVTIVAGISLTFFGDVHHLVFTVCLLWCCSEREREIIMFQQIITVEPRLMATPQPLTLNCDHDITDNSECPGSISIDFSLFKSPQQRTPLYCV